MPESLPGSEQRKKVCETVGLQYGGGLWARTAWKGWALAGHRPWERPARLIPDTPKWNPIGSLVSLKGQGPGWGDSVG